MTLDDFKKKLLDDPNVRAEYDALEDEYSLREQFIRLRTEQNMTQKELAERIGTKQSSIARFESGDINPSFGFLQKVAGGLGKRLRFVLA